MCSSDLYDHMGRRGERDPQLWNIADDYCVNQDLLDQKIGERIPVGLYDTKYKGWSAEEVYDDLMKNAKEINIEDLEKKMYSDPAARSAQKVLAHELTRLVHGEAAALASENASRVLFSKDPKVLDGLSPQGLELLAQEVPSSRLLEEVGLLDLLVQTKLASSKGEARRHVKSGAVSMNREKVSDENLKVSQASFGNHKVILLGVGKSNLHLVLKN